MISKQLQHPSLDLVLIVRVLSNTSMLVSMWNVEIAEIASVGFAYQLKIKQKDGLAGLLMISAQKSLLFKISTRDSFSLIYCNSYLFILP